MVPPEPIYLPLHVVGLIFEVPQSSFKKVNETSQTVYMALVSPKETQLHTEWHINSCGEVNFSEKNVILSHLLKMHMDYQYQKMLSLAQGPKIS